MAVRCALVVCLAFVACGGAEADARLRGTVTWSKSGGFVGVVQKLTVRADGRGVASDFDARRAFRLPASRLRAVERAVRRADPDSADSRPPFDGAADYFSYAIAYRGERVTWHDLARQPPERVLRLHRLLEEIYEQYAPR